MKIVRTRLPLLRPGLDRAAAAQLTLDVSEDNIQHYGDQRQRELQRVIWRR